jgi:plastocyanin domain-containing protein
MELHRRIAGIAVAAMAVIALGAWGCAEKAAGPQTVKVTVSDRGFVPAEIQVERGRPVTLLVTRETDATCAKEIVIADAGVRKELPLHEEVEVTFTPEKKGELRYACGMDMIAGKLEVR